MSPQAFLTDEEIAAVLSYARNSFGNKANSVSIGEVKLDLKESELPTKKNWYMNDCQGKKPF